MTSLGKVPVTRRPTNLPSEKSEHSGNDPSINLVPSGCTGWGNKPNEAGPTTTTPVVSIEYISIISVYHFIFYRFLYVQNTNTSTNVPVSNVVMTGTSPQVPLAQHYPPTSRMPPTSIGGHVPVHHGHTDVKTWAIMAHGGDSLAPNFLTPQSPLFQHEFPSLSSNSENASSTTPVTATAIQKPTANTTADTQYGPGPSLRPQTEGSWIHGGSRPQGSIGSVGGNQSATAPAPARSMGSYPPALGPNGARNNLGPSGVAVAPVGPYPPIMIQQHMVPPQFDGMMPPFMLRNYPPGNFPPPTIQGTMKSAGSRALYGSFVPPGTSDMSGKRFDEEDMKIRPIIKEEDLNQMASIGKDIGWAGHEDMDYNQKLKFSDDEDNENGRDSHNRTRTKTQQSIKGNNKTAEKTDSIEKENNFRSSKESLKDRDKLYSVDPRNSDMRSAWQMRRTVISAPAPTAPRYQLPGNGRFEEDDETWQEKARQKKEEMEVVIQRAKVRREEEEKRFLEQQQAAAEKLRKLEAEIFANQSNIKENKGATHDMLPQWEKEKYQPQNANGDDAKKTRNVTPIPVVKDASEFRELTQLVDRSTFVKKDVRERETAQQGDFSRSYSGNIAPRFQNTNRQNSNGYSSSSSTAPTRGIVSQTSQFSTKSVNLSYTNSRSVQRDCDSQSEKDLDWSVDIARKDRDVERYSKEPSHEHDYDYNYDIDRKFNKEVDKKSNYGNASDSYSRELDRIKVEHKNDESDRDKVKTYDSRHYLENENQDKEERRRSYEDSQKSHHYHNSLSRSSGNFPDNENHERKRSREEVIYENVKLYNAGKDYYRKPDSSIREKSDVDHRAIEKGRNRESSFVELKKETGAKRGYEMEMKKEKEIYKDQERKSPCTYDGRLRENRLKRDSHESLREESYIIQEGRSYSWVDDSNMDDRRIRKDHYREDRSDRYSYAQRAPPKPITREKLEAKELELDSKGNLIALGRSDRKTETKKVEVGETNEKGKEDKSMKTDSKNISNEQKLDSQVEAPSAWKKDKKKNDEFKISQTFDGTRNQYPDKNDNVKGKGEKKVNVGKVFSKNDLGDKSAEEKRTIDRRKADRRTKESCSWSKPMVYHGSSYGGGRNEHNGRRANRGISIKGPSHRDFKYSESEYSDEICGSGREESSARNDREKGRPSKPKRYDRDYRVDERDYRNSRGRNNQDYYYTKPALRNRNSGFRNSGGSSVGKRVDGYGPPTTKNPFSGSGSEDKRQKYSQKDNSSTNEQNAMVKKNEAGSSSMFNFSTNEQNAMEKKNETGSSSKLSTRATATGDRGWKKNIESQQTADNKSTVSSPTSIQTAEANDEFYATAVEGSDSEDSAHIQKLKATSSSKRTVTVVATKASRKPFRSTSRKRYESRRTGPLYSRKDSNTYLIGTKRIPASSGAKSSTSNKENEKYSDDVTRSSTIKGDSKMPEKFTKEYVDVQSKNNLKLRNRSNSRKNIRSAGLVRSRKSSQEMPARLQGKTKVADGKSTNSKESKSSECITSHFRELGPPVPAPPPASNAWDKPLTGALRTGSPSTQRPGGAPAVSNASIASTATNAMEKSLVQIPERKESPALVIDTAVTLGITEKVTAKVLDNLDGTTPPVQTIIFENRNFKSVSPDISSKTKYSQMKNHRFDKDSKLEGLESNVRFGNNTSNTELPMTLFNKNEDCADMKLDFAFDSSDFSGLTDDKSRKVIELSHAMHLVQASTDAELNLKIASVKKVWDGSLAEHYDDKYNTNMVNRTNSFSPSFSSHTSDPNSGSCFSHVDSSGHVQVDDGGLGHSEVVFSPVSQIQNVSSAYGSSQAVLMKNDVNSCSNVCKVKPQPQGSCANVVNAAQSSVISTSLVSQPPPMSSSSYTFSCSTQQANLSNGAVAASALPINYAGAQYNVSPVPSSPVLFNTTPTPNAAAGLYQAFQIDNQVAGRTQFGQYPSFNISSSLGQTSAMSQHSLYVQPPPNPAQSDIYSQQLHSFRMQPQNAFGNSQQITTPNTTMLTSNSLMTAAVKQSSTIGSKSAGYQTAPPASQIFMLDPTTQLFNPNFVPGNQMIQRSHSNVAASLTASTSFYNSGTAQTGYFPGTNSTMPPQTGTAIGLATAYNTQSGTQSLGIQNYNLTQQFKSAQNYMKSSGNSSNLTADFGTNKPITISNQHDILNTVYQSNSQLTNKQRLQQGNKNAQPVHQQVSQYSINQNAFGYSAPNPMRNNGSAIKSSQYPHPIQRPPSQGNNPNRNNGAGTSVNSASSAHSHRLSVRNNSHQLMNNIQQPPCSVYYSTSSGYGSSKHEASSVESKNEANADTKVAESIKSLNVENVSATPDKSATSNE